MGKVELIQEAIINAYEGKSKLTKEILDLPSFSSHNIKHLLNNLGGISTRFLEIGLHKAGTFVAAMFENDCIGVGVDNWSQLEQGGLSKKMAYDNCLKYLDELKIAIREIDCFKITGVEYTTKHDKLPIRDFDFYSYDGDHSFESQFKGITHFLPYMANEFILTVDDTNWQVPREATLKAINYLELEIVYVKHLTDGKDNGVWHNGMDVFLLRKNKYGK